MSFVQLGLAATNFKSPPVGAYESNFPLKLENHHQRPETNQNQQTDMRFHIEVIQDFYNFFCLPKHFLEKIEKCVDVLKVLIADSIINISC